MRRNNTPDSSQDPHLRLAAHDRSNAQDIQLAANEVLLNNNQIYDPKQE